MITWRQHIKKSQRKYILKEYFKWWETVRFYEVNGFPSIKRIKQHNMIKRMNIDDITVQPLVDPNSTNLISGMCITYSFSDEV